MTIKRVLAYASGLVALISMFLAVLTRLFFLNKAVFGLSALSYLRVTNTMLLFAIVFWLFECRGRAD
jgi:hypothetical protein